MIIHTYLANKRKGHSVLMVQIMHAIVPPRNVQHSVNPIEASIFKYVEHNKLEKKKKANKIKREYFVNTFIR